MKEKDITTIEKIDGNVVFQFIAGTLPYTGGILNSISLKANKIREKRFLNFLASISEDVKKIEEEKVDKKFLETDEFFSLLEFTWSRLAENDDNEKLRYLKAFFLRTVLHVRPDITLREMFKRYLTNMSGSHLRILEIIYHRQRRYSQSDRAQLPSPVDGEIPLSVDQIKEVLECYEKPLIRALLMDLISFGLIGDWALTHSDEKIYTNFYITQNGYIFMKDLEDILDKCA